DLAAVDDRVAEPEEDVLELAPNLRDQVQLSAADRSSRNRDVDDVFAEAPVELGPLELFLAPVEGRLEAFPERVQPHARLPVADLAQGELQRALAPQVLDAGGLEIPDRSRTGHSCQRLPFELGRIHGGDCTRSDPSFFAHRSPLTRTDETA